MPFRTGAADEHLVHIGLKAVVGYIAPGGQLHPKGIGCVVFAAGKACGDKRQLAVVGKFLAGGRFEIAAASSCL